MGSDISQNQNSADTQPGRQPLTVMVKPVGSRCNMHCSYCYYLDRGKYSSHEKQLRLNLNLLEKLIRQTIEASPGPVVSFVWHGGEPTLAGLDFYRYVIEYELRYLPAGWQVWNNIQTNGLLLDDQWCEFLAENHFDVGVSIDGTAAMHDKNRPDLGGHGTYERVRRSIERLKKAGISPDLLCTVNSDTVTEPLAVYRALRDLNTGWIQFIPVVERVPAGDCPSGEIPVSEHSVRPEQYGHFLCEIFDEWLTCDLGGTDVQLFAETARVMAGGQASLCTMAPTCGRVLIAEEDGSVYSCDHFVNPDHRIGSLKKTRIDVLSDSAQQLSFGNAKRDTLTGHCLKCPWLYICNGGCPKDRFGISSEGEQGQYYLCAGLEQYFSHACPLLERAMEMSRAGSSPRQMMRRFRSILQEN